MKMRIFIQSFIVIITSIGCKTNHAKQDFENLTDLLYTNRKSIKIRDYISRPYFSKAWHLINKIDSFNPSDKLDFSIVNLSSERKLLLMDTQDTIELLYDDDVKFLLDSSHLMFLFKKSPLVCDKLVRNNSQEINNEIERVENLLLFAEFLMNDIANFETAEKLLNEYLKKGGKFKVRAIKSLELCMTKSQTRDSLLNFLKANLGINKAEVSYILGTNYEPNNDEKAKYWIRKSMSYGNCLAFDRYLFLLGDNTDSLDIYMNKCLSCGSDTISSLCLSYLANFYFKKSICDSAKIYFNQALNIKYRSPLIYNDIARFYDSNKCNYNVDSALKYYKLAYRHTHSWTARDRLKLLGVNPEKVLESDKR